LVVVVIVFVVAVFIPPSESLSVSSSFSFVFVVATAVFIAAVVASPRNYVAIFMRSPVTTSTFLWSHGIRCPG
jgi:Zn-dependent protease